VLAALVLFMVIGMIASRFTGMPSAMP